MITNFTKISILFLISCWFSQSSYAETREETGLATSEKWKWYASTSLPVDKSDVSVLANPNKGKTVVLKFAVDPPTATEGANCGPGPVTLTAAGGTNGNYRWYTTATEGTAISNATNATYTTPVLNATTTYYVALVSGNEESARTPVTATINPIPMAPAAPSEFILCQGTENVTLPDVGPVLKWYTAATGGTDLGTTPTINTAVVGTTEYYVALNLLGCESPRTKITVVILGLPSRPTVTTTTICTGETATLSATGASTGGSYRWYTNLTGGIAINGATSSTYTTPVLTATTIYYVSTVNNMGCESERTAVTATVNAAITNNTITGEQALCAGVMPAQLTGSTPTGGNGTYPFLWESSTDGTMYIPATGVNNSSNYLPGVLTTNTWFRRSITSACGSVVSNSIKVTVSPAPASPTVNDMTICTGTNATLGVSAPAAGYTYRWYATATGGIIITTGTTYTTPNLTATTNYYVEALNAAGCMSAREAVTVNVNNVLTAPTVTNTQRCGAGSVTLMATGAPTGASYQWYTEATGGTAISGVTTGTYTTPDLTATTTYYVAVVNGSNCESARTAVTATINALPTAPVVTTTSTYCQGTIASALTATGDNLQWYTTATGGTAATTAPTPATTTAGSTDYYVTQTVNGCESDRAKITVTVTALPTVTLAAFTTPVCSTITDFVLTGGQPAGGTFSGPGVSNGLFNATTAGEGTHTITYTYTENGCSNTATQTITVTTCTGLPDSKLAGSLMLYPNPTSAKLQIILPLPAKTNLDLRLMDAKGQIILEQHYGRVAGEFNRVLDVRKQAKGIYILQLIVEDGIITKRVVIE